MKSKVFISLSVFCLIMLISFSSSFAAENSINVVEGIRNIVGGAENVVENTGKGIVQGVQNVTEGGQNMMSDSMESIGNTAEDMRGSSSIVSDDNNGGNYTATRTTNRSATPYSNDSTLFGMSQTMWTWLIMGIVGAAIIGLVWWYASENKNSYNDNNY